MKQLRIQAFETAIGIVHIGCTEESVCLLEFDIEERLERHKKLLSNEYQLEENAQFAQHSNCLRQLTEYFEGTRKKFDLNLRLTGSDFQKSVWNELLTIPFGKTVSYGALAETLGDKAAVRAVARANGQNHIAIIIPCHRVIGSDQTLTGYSGGIEKKAFLLDLESGQQSLFG